MMRWFWVLGMNPTVLRRGAFALVAIAVLGVLGCKDSSAPPPTATKLAFTVQPSNIASKAAVAPAVQVAVQDASGNTVTSANDNITLAIGTNPGSGTLSGTATAAAVNGVATFNNLSIEKAGSGYNLT